MKAPYRWSAYILLQSNRLQKVEWLCESNLKQDSEARCKSLFGVTDVRQMVREWSYMIAMLLKFLMNCYHTSKQMVGG